MDRPDRPTGIIECGLLLGYFFSMLGDIIADIAVIEELEKWVDRLRLRTIAVITGS
jgi:hypothetical protein